MYFQFQSNILTKYVKNGEKINIKVTVVYATCNNYSVRREIKFYQTILKRNFIKTIHLSQPYYLYVTDVRIYKYYYL